MAEWNDRWFGGHLCENLVRKLTMGELLDESEKAHISVCEACMAQLVISLDESAISTVRTNGDVTHVRPEAQKALEHGCKVFQREFGISLAREKQ